MSNDLKTAMLARIAEVLSFWTLIIGAFIGYMHYNKYVSFWKPHEHVTFLLQSICIAIVLFAINRASSMLRKKYTKLAKDELDNY